MQADDDWTPETVPSDAQRLYRLCWQLESWLRTIVYVELRAGIIDWEEPLKRAVQQWPPKSLAKDKGLHHMATFHRAAISYMTFGELWSVVADDRTWPMFEPYFPPKDNTIARIKEVKAIRNRTAHFRQPHKHDVDRLRLFIQDLEPGVRRFCSRYTQGMMLRKPEDDLVGKALEVDWNARGYGVELDRLNGDWLYAPEPHRQRPRLNATLDFMSHERYTPGSLDGVVYAVRMHCLDTPIDYGQFLLRTRHLHRDLIHIILLSEHQLTVTIPGVLGVEKAADLVFETLSAALNSRTSSAMRLTKRPDCPEYVLWPDHWLAFYSDDMVEPVLDLR